MIKKMEVSGTSRRMVLVLGMHRSGTSALGGMLQYLGCSMPNQAMAAHENNPRGYFESQGVRRFNDRLLSASGSNWRDWLPFNQAWLTSPEAQAFTQEATNLLAEEFGEAELVMLKEPRLCRLMPFWQKVIEAADFSVLPILTHRNPVEVAKSLEARDGMLAEEAMLLWLRHVLDAEWCTRGLPRYVTSYQKLLDDWPATARRAGEALGVAWPRNEQATKDIDDFLSKDLRHHQESAGSMVANATFSAWIRESYEILERWSEEGYAPSDYKALDRIRTEFDMAAREFGGLVRSVRDTSEAKLQAERRRSAVLEGRVKERDARIEEIKSDLENAAERERAWQVQQETLQAELLDQTERNTLLQRGLEAARTELAQGHTALADRWLEAVQASERAEISDAYAALLTELLQEAEALKARLSDRVAVLEAAEKASQREMVRMAKLILKSEDSRKLAKSSFKQAVLERDAALAANAASVAEIERLSLEAAKERQDKESEAARFEKAAQESDEARKANDASMAEIARIAQEAAMDRQIRDAKITYLATELEAMRSSASWRLTKPVRHLVGQLRGDHR